MEKLRDKDMVEIRRDIHLERIKARMHNGMIKIITGMRRVGKSYLLFHLFYNYLRKAGVADDHIVRVDLEDRRNAALRDPDALLAYIDSRIDDGFSKVLIVGMPTPRYQDADGITIMSIYDFLLNADSLDTI